MQNEDMDKQLYPYNAIPILVALHNFLTKLPNAKKKNFSISQEKKQRKYREGEKNLESCPTILLAPSDCFIPNQVLLAFCPCPYPVPNCSN